MAYRYIGKSVPRVDGVEKITGEALFGADVKLPGMLYGKILRSTRPHARILNIDTSKARSLPGVKAVVTAEDAPDVLYTVHYIYDQCLFARRKVRYIGERIAAVAAIDIDTAEEALELIDVEYEDLPAVFDPVAAMEPGAPLIHEDLPGYQAKYEAIKYGNVCSYIKIKHGDVESGFSQADLIVENTFTTPRVHQAYIEPHACIASVDGSGKVTVWTTSQIPFRVRAAICQTLKLPMSQVRVIATHVGGGFGGKECLVDHVATLLAQKTGKPVQIVLTRDEDFAVSRPRVPSRNTLKTGVKRDGRITAFQARYVWDAGAYADQSPGITAYAATFAKGPYKVENVLVDAYCVYTNQIVTGAFRGYGSPQQCWATESQMDIIARALDMDPVELRRKNGIDNGDRLATGQVCRNVAMKATLEAAASHVHWDAETPHINQPYQGRGIACMQRGFGIYSSGALIKANEDGTYGVMVGSTDIGTGVKTVLTQIAAEELGVSMSGIQLVTADTDTTPYDYGTVASRITYNAGNSIRKAAADVRQQLFKLAADRLEADPEELDLLDGRVIVRGTPEMSVSVAALVEEAVRKSGGPILGRGAFIGTGTPMEPGTVMGYPLGPFPGLVYATQIAEVEVDPETGKVTVLRIVCAEDVGKAINPAGAEAQIQGGLAQGLGMALAEEMILKDGRVLNPRFLDYKIPTAMDVPPVDVIMVEVPEDTGPYGAKGVGEPILVPTAPAIGNAIYDAIGVRIKDLPITPEKILRALREKQSSEGGHNGNG